MTLSRSRRRFACLFALSLCLLAGCGRLRPGAQTQYVYVVSKGTFLRDRVAAVSNKVTDIHNGDRLEVLEHQRRFLQVKTDAGKVGWLEEHAVIDQAAYDKFQALAKQHANDPVVATAILRDELFLHLAAGRNTDHLYLLPENDKLQLLMRAAVAKPAVPGALVMPVKPLRPRKLAPRPGKPVRKVASGSTIWAAAPTHPDPSVAPDLDPPAEPLEDWWLIRDQSGKVGWVLARRLDVDVPDQIVQYSEGKRIVGAYMLNKVYDDEATTPDKQVAQFVTVTTEFRDGLPFDWDQVRVFIWNSKKHRYETAYRLREQQGYLPVTIGQKDFKDGAGKDMGLEPTFTIRTTPDGVVTQDTVTGSFHPQTVETTTYRLEGGIVRRADPPPPPLPPAPASAAQAAVPGAASATATAGAPVAKSAVVRPRRGPAVRRRRAAPRPRKGPHKGPLTAQQKKAALHRHAKAVPAVRG